MAERRTRQDFLAFLDWMSEKGLMAKNTVAARKAAANKVLGILNNDEAQDVTALDVDDVMRQFTNLEGRTYTPGSLTTYLSQLRSALDDFRIYLDQPLSFRPGVQPRERRTHDVAKEASPATIRKEETPLGTERSFDSNSASYDNHYSWSALRSQRNGGSQNCQCYSRNGYAHRIRTAGAT